MRPHNRHASGHSAAERLLYGIVLCAIFPVLAFAAPVTGQPARDAPPPAGPPSAMADGSTRAVFNPMSQIDAALRENRLALAERLYRALLARDPSHREAYDGLLRLSSRRPLPVESRRYTLGRRLLPSGFREFVSKRFVVLSNANGRWTRALQEA